MNPLPPYTRLGERVLCAACRSEYVVNGLTAPSLLSTQRRVAALVTILLLAAVAFGAYYLWQRLSPPPQPWVSDYTLTTEGGRIVYTYTLHNDGGGGLVELRPHYWTASGKVVDLSATGTGREIVRVGRHQTQIRQGTAVVRGEEWPVRFKVECRPYHLGER
jgi:membrane protein implicated in regulation of membrane protease activity